MFSPIELAIYVSSLNLFSAERLRATFMLTVVRPLHRPLRAPTVARARFRSLHANDNDKSRYRRAAAPLSLVRNWHAKVVYFWFISLERYHLVCLTQKVYNLQVCGRFYSMRRQTCTVRRRWRCCRSMHCRIRH